MVRTDSTLGRQGGGALNLYYCANALPGELCLPSNYVEHCTAEYLAELAAADHWQYHLDDVPTLITVVHLRDVEGHDLGLFEVRCSHRTVFKAEQLRSA